MFHIIKQILMLAEDNPVKFKIWLLNDDFIY